ncbi:MAG: hypothetical protein ACE5KS_00300 [Woeseiaceae bacterium]
MRISPMIATALPLLALASLADDADGWMDTFPIEKYTMVSEGQNRYWSLKPGRFVVLGELTPGGGEFVLISVLEETETVDGIETRVIEEREYEDGELVEVSRNFFAMAQETKDVFYFGEDVNDYEDGKVVGHGGQWRAGQDDARAGLYMPGKPEVGMRYYMEYHPGTAMDRAEIYETNATVETPAGTFSNSLIVTESSPIEPAEESYKRYAPRIGMIYDDGLELYKRGRRYRSEKMIEFEIAEAQMPATPARIVRELHPAGVIREVKVEIHPDRVQDAVETFIDGKQWDVEVTDEGEVYRNTPD